MIVSTAATIDEYWELQKDRLTGPIPQCIGNLVHLKELNLHQNNFTGDPAVFVAFDYAMSIIMCLCPGEVPSTITNLSCLEVLRLSWNNLQGTNNITEHGPRAHVLRLT